MSGTFAWQGWRLSLPARWNPIRLTGDYQRGEAMLADLHRPRLALRWKEVGRGFDSQTWAERALRDELGQLAADEARPLQVPAGSFDASMLCIEPKPPGRDVWVGYSATSHRAIELVYHTRRRDHALAALVPALIDCPTDQPMPWSVFDLSCRVPAGLVMQKHVLLAGDLSLIFADKQRYLAIRQIAMADMALNRMPLEKWLADQERRVARRYKTAGQAQEITATAGQRTLRGLQRQLMRRRRYFWLCTMVPQLVTLAVHDEQFNRLVLAQASDEKLAREAIASVGWADPNNCA